LAQTIWARMRKGPPYLKIGGRVVYELAQIETFEASQRQNPVASNEEAPKC
jgi:hypothetical protein